MSKNKISEKEIIINLKEEIDYFDFDNILLELIKEFGAKALKFEGYLNSCKVISLYENKYRVYPGKDRIKLTLTVDKGVIVPKGAKEKAFIKYNNFIENNL